MQLRGYQDDLVAEALDTYYNEDPVSSLFLQLPTGGGKTLIGARLLSGEEFAGRANAWLTHRRELAKQTASRLHGPVLHVSADVPKRLRRFACPGVTVISPSLQAWPQLPDAPGLLVVDEAHHTPAATWQKRVREWREAGGRVLGLSATPWRMRTTQALTPWYDRLVCGPSVRALQEGGWLAVPRVVSPQEAQFDRGTLRKLGTGDYRLRDVEAQTARLLGQHAATQAWQRHTEGWDDRRTLWFCATVRAAEALAGVLDGDGCGRAAVLTGKTPAAERDRILSDVETGGITHLCSVEVVSEGVDFPAIPVIASLRPTKSLALYLQQCGRGSRPKGEPGVDGGEYLLLDFAGNVGEFGPPDMDRRWSLEARADHNPGDPAWWFAYCVSESCEAVVHPSARECWACGAGQYGECGDCRRDRRLTRIRPSGVCDDCDTARRRAALAAAEHTPEPLQPAGRPLLPQAVREQHGWRGIMAAASPPGGSPPRARHPLYLPPDTAVRFRFAAEWGDEAGWCVMSRTWDPGRSSYRWHVPTDPSRPSDAKNVVLAVANMLSGPDRQEVVIIPPPAFDAAKLHPGDPDWRAVTNKVEVELTRSGMGKRTRYALTTVGGAAAVKEPTPGLLAAVVATMLRR